MLEAFTVEASGKLAAEIAGGAEVPFEIVEERGGSAALYCYRPLTGEFIAGRVTALRTLGSYGPVADVIVDCEGLDVYLSEQGAARVPSDRRGCAEAAIATFLGCVFADRSEFGFEPVHFEAAYADLEHALYEGHCTATVVAPVLGLALDPDTTDLSLGDGLSLIEAMRCATRRPRPCGVTGMGQRAPAVLAVDQERSARPRYRWPGFARRILTALRETTRRGGTRSGRSPGHGVRPGSWRPVAVDEQQTAAADDRSGRARRRAARGFCDLVSHASCGRRALTWALARFEMGCERLAPFEALTDYLLALRALLEPEAQPAAAWRNAWR